MPTRLTPARAALLRRIADGPVYVLRDPAAVGAGLSRRTLDALRRDGQADYGAYEPMRGRLLTLTDHGREVLAAYEQQAGTR